MSPVRDLRAMFENKGDSSPPDRGRSPAGSTPTQNPSGGNESVSPRPLSKVRTNFVAIEKDGRIGLQRENSGESSLSRRRLSSEVSQDRPSMASDDTARSARLPVFGESIPESPRSDAPRVDAADDAGAVSDKPSVNPDKQVDEEQSAASLSTGDPTAKTTPKSPAPGTPSTPAKDSTQKTGKTKEPSKASMDKKTTSRVSTLGTKPPAKAALKPSPPTKAPSDAAKKPDPKANDKGAPKPTTARTTTTAARPKPIATSAPAKKPPHASDTGFVKPKPKSPTKPVPLPSSLTAPTASSVSKGNLPGQSSKQSGSAPIPAAPAKPPQRQGSVANRSRPSIGPPPTKSGTHDSAASKRQSNVDESFLARMTRHTQASSSKTSDKPPSPPRRTAQRPPTADIDHGTRRESSVKRVIRAQSSASSHKPSEPTTSQGSAGRPAEKTGRKISTGKAPPTIASKLTSKKDASEKPAAFAVQAPVPAPAPAETAAAETANVESAEEAASLAQEAELAQTPVGADQLQQESKSTTVEETAPEIAKVETVEEATDLAKEADLIQEPVEPEAQPTDAEPKAVEEATPEAANTDTPEDATSHAEDAERIETPVQASEPGEPEEPETSLAAEEVPEPTSTEKDEKDVDVAEDEDAAHDSLPATQSVAESDKATDDKVEAESEAGIREDVLEKPSEVGQEEDSFASDDVPASFLPVDVTNGRKDDVAVSGGVEHATEERTKSEELDSTSH